MAHPHTEIAGTESPVAIVLVNWNGWKECIECMDTLLVQLHQDFHIFIVDNDSQDLSIERIIAWCGSPTSDQNWRRQEGVGRYTDLAQRAPITYRLIERTADTPAPIPEGCKLTLVRSGGNLGFAGGCNVGIRVAGLQEFSHFWFLNADTVIERRALVELLARENVEPGLGIVGSTLLFYDAPGRIFALAGGYIDPKNASSRHIGVGSPLADVPDDPLGVERALTFVCGASMLVSARFIREIGLMQEDYFLYYEDADWAMRARAQDRFRLGYAPGSVVYHKSGANSSKLVPVFSARFYYRNRLRFVSRYLPQRLGAAKRRLFSEMLRHVVRGRWVHARLVASILLVPNAAD
jgi:GT2 family glycosyltransferase